MSDKATLRLKRDYIRILRDPLPFIVVQPLPENILEWHYVILGTPGTPFENGIYHGKLIFPEEFPFKPPSIMMLTPNGRFKTGTRLCLSISDFHPETWNPTWNAGAILLGLQSFMAERTRTAGSVQSTDDRKRLLAEKSLKFNLSDPTFCELFPTLAEECRSSVRERQEEKQRNRAKLRANTGAIDSIDFEEKCTRRGSVCTRCVVMIGIAAIAFFAGKYFMSEASQT
ncbi:ubiquitin-conjugating enzyme E2 J2-like [Galendromus occidentalis]|uniref:Ubiquitin-conjugating enzyme E2 J2 n=1 Tax=Galendromus occidentalis TaxID=34638 RepID=A0AAJ6QRX2_9ACAR|nr:ubiquitin-conjugating enzyme E2 J2-like [Galendromus occidentalis]